MPRDAPRRTRTPVAPGPPQCRGGQRGTHPAIPVQGKSAVDPEEIPVIDGQLDLLDELEETDGPVQDMR